MKSLSLVSLTTVLMLSAVPFALAQTSVTGTVGTTVDGATGTSEGAASAGGTSSASAGNGQVDLSLDTNADGTVDAEEQAAAGVGASGSVDLSLDTNGDGTVDEAEAAAGASTTATEACDSVDLAAVSTGAQASEIAAVTNAQVIRLTDCADGSGGSLSADVLDAISANAAIGTVLQQETVAAGEIAGVSVDGQTVLIYVREDDNSGDDTDTNSSAQ